MHTLPKDSKCDFLDNPGENDGKHEQSVNFLKDLFSKKQGIEYLTGKSREKVSDDVKSILSNLKVGFIGKCVLSESPLLEEYLKKKCDPNMLSDKNYTPSMLAALINDKNSAEILKKYGADLSLINDDGQNAMDIACKHSSTNFLEVFSDSPLITKKDNTTLYSSNVTEWREGIAQFCLLQNEKNDLHNQPTTEVSYESSTTVENLTKYLVPASSALLTTLAAGVIATTENIVKAINGSTINNVTHDMVAFHPDHSENMGGLAMAAVGVTAVGILGG